jgi:cephalosporin-C deacetylase-like acetyl esterase
LLLWACALLGAAPAAPAQEIVTTASTPDAVYRAGETAHWGIELRGPGTDGAAEVRYVVKRNGLQPVREGALPLQNGRAELEARLDAPGTLLVELKAKLKDREVSGLAGAAFSPNKLSPSLPRPKDFDRFWKAKLAELAKVPANPRLEEVEIGSRSIRYYKLTMDNIRGSKIYGQLARPAADGKRPALLVVQWAGVYPLRREWITGRAEAGWLVLDIMAHDLPFDQPQAFYDEAARTTLANYPAIGNDDRDKSYFLRMYLSCYRAAEYLTRRADWDGRTLVVTGGSQGGLQTIVTAALHPKVTAGIADVPAGCDLNGPEAGRAPGWPMWYWATQGKDEKNVRAASRYYDVVNFASRVKAPILIGLGLVDTVCPAPGVFTMSNQLKGRREVVVMPQAGHGGDHGVYQQRAEAWLGALVKREALPLRTGGAKSAHR